MVMHGSHDWRLVVLSVAIAVLAAAAALDLAGRATAARDRGRGRIRWVVGGACAMGIGIWSMHYTGMLAFHLPVPVLYDVPTVLVSLLAAIMASAIALFVVSGPQMMRRQALASSVFMGSGIATMHYTGMAAMRLPAVTGYEPFLFGLSVLIAIMVSLVALWLAFHFRETGSHWGWRKLGSALLMGAAIPAMHYTGMAAAEFSAAPTSGDVSFAIAISPLATAAISIFTVMILVLAFVTSAIDRRFTVQTDALKSSERLLREVIDADPNLIFVKDREGRFTLVNQAVADLCGTSIEGLFGKSTADFRTNQKGVEHLLRDDPAVQAGKRSSFFAEEAVTNPDTDETRWFQTVRVPLVSADGGAPQVLGVATDITARKRAAEALHESEERFRALTGSAADAIVSTDSKGAITYFNPGAERAFGYAVEEVFGRPLTLLIPTLLQEAHEEGLQQYLKADGARVVGKTVELTGKRKNGTEFPVEVSLASWGGGSKAPSFVAVIRDVTDRKTLETQFQQAQKMDAVGRLAGGIAHDFNNLLNVISGYTDLLLDKFHADHSVHADISEIKRAADRATAVTSQLLAFSRKQVRQPKALELTTVVAQMETLLRRLIGEQIELIARLDRDTGCIKADPGQLEQIVVNLAINARDAMPEGGKLTIQTGNIDLDETAARTHSPAMPGRYVELVLSDTGVGMDQETQARIFEPFFTTKPAGKGTGLGLAMVYGIVKQNQGLIWVYSELGLGTTIKIHFPRVAEVAEPSAPNALQTAAPRGSETVLVAEDESGLRALTRKILEAKGYEVLTAANGTDALGIAERYLGPIQLLISDVVMPGMGGRELAQRLAAVRPAAKVLFVSGHTDEVITYHGVLDTGTAFLQKPFTAEALARRVREVLDEP